MLMRYRSLTVLLFCTKVDKSSLERPTKQKDTLKISDSNVRSRLSKPQHTILTQKPGPSRQTTPDFLTSMTSPQERRIKPGFENCVPRTPDDFAERWQASDLRKRLRQELDVYEHNHPPEQRLAEYQDSRRAEQFRSQRAKSPYTISYTAQISLTLWRGWRRLLADPGFTIASLLLNSIMALVIGSMFYNLPNDTSSFYYRGGVIFFGLLFNAFSSQLEASPTYTVNKAILTDMKRS